MNEDMFLEAIKEYNLRRDIQSFIDWMEKIKLEYDKPDAVKPVIKVFSYSEGELTFSGVKYLEAIIECLRRELFETETWLISVAGIKLNKKEE